MEPEPGGGGDVADGIVEEHDVVGLYGVPLAEDLEDRRIGLGDSVVTRQDDVVHCVEHVVRASDERERLGREVREADHSEPGAEELGDQVGRPRYGPGNRFDPTVSPCFERNARVGVALDQVRDEFGERHAEVEPKVLVGREHVGEEVLHLVMIGEDLAKEVAWVPVHDDSSEVERDAGDVAELVGGGFRARRVHRVQRLRRGCGEESIAGAEERGFYAPGVSARVLDGEAAAEAVRFDLAGRVAALRARGVVPGLGTILVGDDGPSRRYVDMKHRDAADLGLHSVQVELGVNATQAEANAAVDRLNADPSVHAFILQYPFPSGLDFSEAMERVHPHKDADGLLPHNLGRLVMGLDAPLACTPAGILRLLAHHGVSVSGRHVVVVGRGLTIGRPLANLLALKRPDANAAVTVVHTGVADIGRFTRTADVVVAAAGVPGLVTADMVAPGAVVVAAGVSFVDGRVVSDVADDVAEVASWLSPRVGGVGPMTRAMLMSNAVDAAERALAESEGGLR